MVDILDTTFDTPTPTPRSDEKSPNKRNMFNERNNEELLDKSPSSTTPEDLYNEMIKKNSHIIATKRLNNRKFSIHGEQLKQELQRDNQDCPCGSGKKYKDCCK